MLISNLLTVTNPMNLLDLLNLLNRPEYPPFLDPMDPKDPIDSIDYLLARVVFYDQLLRNRHVNLFPRRQRQDAPFQRGGVELQPAGKRPEPGLGQFLHPGMITAPRRRRNHQTRFHLKRRNRHLAAIDANVAVQHHLPRFLARRGEAEAVHDIVQSRLQQLQQTHAGDTLCLRRLPEVGFELRFQHPVDAAELLLFPQADAELRRFAPALRMHPRRHGPLVHGTLFRVTLLALEVKLHALAAAQPTNRSCVSAHSNLPHLSRPLASIASTCVCRPTDATDAMDD